MTRVWLRLAWIEWRRSFSLREAGSGSGRRDFTNLTLLLFLTLTLALFVSRSRAGILDQMLNASLGYLEGYGVPVWVIAEVGGSRGTALDREVLDQVEEIGTPGLCTFPYREVESLDVSLPMERGAVDGLWQGGEMAFRGRAVGLDDPLWLLSTGREDSGAAEKPPRPLEVVLSRSLFAERFRCAGYLEALRSRPPEPLLAPPSEGPRSGSEPAVSESGVPGCLAEGRLWLEVRLNFGRELHPFRIHWQERIPAMEELAFLLPLETFNAVKIAQQGRISRRAREAFRYFPEAEGLASRRVAELLLWPGPEGLPSEETFDALLSCLGGGEHRKAQLRLERPAPTSWVAACAATLGLPVQEDSSDSGDPPEPPYLAVANSTPGQAMPRPLSLPCNLLGPSLQDVFECSGDGQVAIDPLRALAGFPSALVYVPDRGDLSKTIDGLLAIPGPTEIALTADEPARRRPALVMHPSYRDALVRFTFLSTVMSILDSYYVLFSLAFLAVLFLVQVSFVVLHRRQVYGILLAKGLPWRGICVLLLAQVFFSFVLALAAGAAVVTACQLLVNGELSGLLAEPPYLGRILGEPDLLPFSWTSFLAQTVLGWAVSCMVAVGWLLWICPPRRPEPSRLLHT